jgi:membrane associated rhomboid family serine protease
MAGMAAETETCYRHPDEETRVHCARCGRPICPECMTVAPVGHQCPTCVAEARRDVGRRRVRLRRPRSATTVLLGLNVGVFVLDLVLRAATGGDVLLQLGAMVPSLVAGGEYYRLVTAMFLHIGVLHLLLNSFGLYIFGNVIETVYGTARFIAVYLVTGLFASTTSFAFGDPGTAAAGASGAIFGLVGAWLAYNLRRRSLVLARANVQGALVLIGVNLLFGFTVPGVDNLAHLGGLAAGIAAGFVAEGWGPARWRVATAAAGLAGLVVAAGVLATWRAAELAPVIGVLGPPA